MAADDTANTLNTLSKLLLNRNYRPLIYIGTYTFTDRTKIFETADGERVSRFDAVSRSMESDCNIRRLKSTLEHIRASACRSRC